MTEALKRQHAYRRRKQTGRVLVAVEVGLAEIRALQSLALLGDDAADKAAVAEGVQRFLACAPTIAAIPGKLYPR